MDTGTVTDITLPRTHQDSGKPSTKTANRSQYTQFYYLYLRSCIDSCSTTRVERNNPTLNYSEQLKDLLADYNNRYLCR